MDYTRYNHLTHAELSKHIATLEHPSDLEVECMQRIDMLLELVHELEEGVKTVPLGTLFDAYEEELAAKAGA